MLLPSPRALPRLAAAAAVLFAVGAMSGSVHADSSAQDKAAAEALFQQGKKLLASGRAAEACPKFASSQQLDPGIGTMLNLGDCYEKNHQLASAWAIFKEVATSARAAGQAERAEEARKRAAALEPRLPQLLIQVTPGDASGITAIRRDGSPVAPSTWDVPLPVDPGDHQIEASGPGRQTWSERVTAVEAKTTTVKVPVLEPDPAAKEPAGQPPAPGGAIQSAPPPATTMSVTGPTGAASRGMSGQRVAALAVGALGLVTVGVGSAVALAAKAKYDGADCPSGNLCYDVGFNDRQSAISSAKTATILFALGTAAVTGGTILWLTAPPSSRGEAAVGLRPLVGVNAAAVSIEGAWR